MRILIVDDEVPAINSLERSLRKILDEKAEIHSAENGEAALSLLDEKACDILFLDIEMPGMNGLDVAKKVSAKHPNTNIIIVTAYKEYAVDALELYVSGYLLKPASLERIRKALEKLRNPIVERLTVQCFGNFDVFYKGEKLTFARSAAKEMLAYLIARRGAAVTAGEFCAVLWDGKDRKDQLSTYFAEMKRALAKVGFSDIVIHTRNDYSINTAKLDCDYYRYLNGDPGAAALYNGEFMLQYSWGEDIAPTFYSKNI